MTLRPTAQLATALVCGVLTAAATACESDGSVGAPLKASSQSSAAMMASAPPMGSTAPSAPAVEPSASASAPVPAAPLDLLRAALFAEDGSIREQTENEPTGEGAVLEAQVAALWDAIVHDDASIAMPFFFPVEAYEQVKGIPEPAKDWKYRLWKDFEKDVHSYHQRLGEDPTKAELVRVEIRAKPEWMKPGREGNLLGYYRVKNSLVHWKTADGKERRFDVTSMISWRGHWFIVHLHGFD